MTVPTLAAGKSPTSAAPPTSPLIQTATACQDACAKDGHQAIVFGDLRNPASPVAKALAQYQSNQIRPELKLNTGVRYHGL